MMRMILDASGDGVADYYTWGDGHGDMDGGGHGDGRMFDDATLAPITDCGYGDNYGSEDGEGYGGMDELGAIYELI